MPFEDDEDFNSDEDFSDEEYEKQRKEKKYRLKNHPLFVQANEIFNIVIALLDSNSSTEEVEMYGPIMKESAMIIVAKLSSGLTSDSYVLCMQNAAIIRDHAEYLRLSEHNLNMMEGFDEKYVQMFRSEMEKFLLLFKDWAAEIHMMVPDWEDEWGLFVK